MMHAGSRIAPVAKWSTTSRLREADLDAAGLDPAAS